MMNPSSPSSSSSPDLNLTDSAVGNNNIIGTDETSSDPISNNASTSTASNAISGNSVSMLASISIPPNRPCRKRCRKSARNSPVGVSSSNCSSPSGLVGVGAIYNTDSPQDEDNPIRMRYSNHSFEHNPAGGGGDTDSANDLESDNDDQGSSSLLHSRHSSSSSIHHKHKLSKPFRHLSFNNKLRRIRRYTVRFIWIFLVLALVLYFLWAEELWIFSGRTGPKHASLHGTISRTPHSSHLAGTALGKAAPVYRYSKAAVATDSPECSEVGSRILKKGGNAVDAAIASSLCLGVRRPFASGIGGGGFMLVHMKNPPQQKKSSSSSTMDPHQQSAHGSYSIDFREYAGQHAHRDMYEENPSKHYDPQKHPFHYGHYDRSTSGGSSVAISGEIKGFFVAHKRFGSLPWSDLFEDAIRMAEEGFHVEPLLALRCKQKEADILKSASVSELLTRPLEESRFSSWLGWGRKTSETKRRVLQAGDFVVQPQLGKTLRLIANKGWRAFYEGAIMREIVKSVQDAGGYLTEQDFKNYRVRVKKAHEVPFHGKDVPEGDASTEKARYSIVTTHAPSSGPITAFALSLLDKVNQREPLSSHDKLQHSNILLNRNARFWHYVIESLKHSFSHRTFLGDPNFVPGVKEFVNSISSLSYIAEIAKKMNPLKTYTDWNHYALDETLIRPHDSGTTAITVIDHDGNAVSMATTVNHSFGSLLYLPQLGFIMNNHMSDFSVSREKMNVFGFLPSEYNRIEAYKRPVSSMSPIIILDHQSDKEEGNVSGEANHSPTVRLAISASGGSTIISSVVQILASHLFHNIPPHKLIPQPRLHILPGMTDVRIEGGFHHTYVQTLEKQFGHSFKEQGLLADGHSIGNVQFMVREEDGSIEAFSDERKMGKPSGF